VKDATWLVWDGEDMDRKGLDLGKARSLQILAEAATLDLTIKDGGSAVLRVTNKTGHKLPSGYEEGRRMWVNVVFLDAAGKVLGELGEYGEKDDVVFGELVRVPTLLDGEKTRVYEILFGISEGQAKKYGVAPGKSFHSVLNDTVLKDNRIPPEGFTNAAFEEHLAGPVGASYADGQHWDDFGFELPAGCRKVVVRLMYESMSWDYLKFLTEENKTDDWGKALYEAWGKTGRGAPTVMATIEKEVAF
jgi:hypothetical protein